MRRSTVYFLIFVAVACIASAIVPRLIITKGPRPVPEDTVLDDAMISAIDIKGGYSLYIWVDSTLETHFVSKISPSAVDFDAETGTLTLQPDPDASSVSVHLTPADTLLAINLTGEFQYININDITTPVLTLSRQPGLSIYNSNIGLLSTGPKVEEPEYSGASMTVQGSTIGLFTTLTPAAELNIDLHSSKVGTL